MSTIQPTLLKHLGVISLTGADTRGFLQGQLTADVDSLTPDNVILAACNSPQGRVQAVLWLVDRPDGIAMLLPRSMIERTVTRLRRYVLRAKVTIEADRLAAGLVTASAITLPSPADRIHQQINEVSFLYWAGHRHALVLAPSSVLTDAVPSEDLTWRQDHLRAGLPMVYPQTHEQFVAQMLNLDVLGGISFEKGCYTGQEIIARTHFRGAVKRRMRRYRLRSEPPAPATRLLADAQHAGDVVDAVATDEGCELLAVVTLTQVDAALELETHPGMELHRLALPYERLDGAQ